MPAFFANYLRHVCIQTRLSYIGTFGSECYDRTRSPSPPPSPTFSSSHPVSPYPPQRRQSLDIPSPIRPLPPVQLSPELNRFPERPSLEIPRVQTIPTRSPAKETAHGYMTPPLSRVETNSTGSQRAEISPLPLRRLSRDLGLTRALC